MGAAFVDPEKKTTEVFRFFKKKKKKNSFVLKFKISQKFQNFKIVNKGLGSIRAKIGPTLDVDTIFSKMYSQYVLFRNKYS